jgi:hypothetical protein
MVLAVQAPSVGIEQKFMGIGEQRQELRPRVVIQP